MENPRFSKPFRLMVKVKIQERFFKLFLLFCHPSYPSFRLVCKGINTGTSKPKDYGIKPFPRTSVTFYSVSFWFCHTHVYDDHANSRNFMIRWDDIKGTVKRKTVPCIFPFEFLLITVLLILQQDNHK
jgi:hypothetical protein